MSHPPVNNPMVFLHMKLTDTNCMLMKTATVNPYNSRRMCQSQVISSSPITSIITYDNNTVRAPSACAKYSKWIHVFNPHVHRPGLCYRWGNRDTETWVNLSPVIQPLRGRAQRSRFRTHQSAWHPADTPWVNFIDEYIRKKITSCFQLQWVNKIYFLIWAFRMSFPGKH